jgi:hypothetical protein
MVDTIARPSTLAPILAALIAAQARLDYDEAAHSDTDELEAQIDDLRCQLAAQIVELQQIKNRKLPCEHLAVEQLDGRRVLVSRLYPTTPMYYVDQRTWEYIMPAAIAKYPLACRAQGRNWLTVLCELPQLLNADYI